MIDKIPYIQKFKQLYLEIYRFDLSDELAVEYFDRLVILYKIVIGLLPEVDNDYS
jgi:hypothetical protein